MSGISNRLKLLEKLLADLESDEAMLLTQLDGFLSGIIICRDLILPGEWLPMVWGGSDSVAAAVFESTKEAEQLIELIMQHYNSIVADLQRGAGHYSPLSSRSGPLQSGTPLAAFDIQRRARRCRLADRQRCLDRPRLKEQLRPIPGMVRARGISRSDPEKRKGGIRVVGIGCRANCDLLPRWFRRILR
jgi:Uncharacterised protein family (UPF0149)